MSDDAISKIFDKVDLINQRLARVETILAERERRCDDEHILTKEMDNRVNQLEQAKTGFMSTRSLLAWLTTTAIAFYGVFKNG